MKKIIHLLVFTLITQLSLAPLELSLFVTKAYANDCPNGQYMDSSLGRCVLKKQVVETKVKSSQCEGLEGDAYAQCFKDNVKDEMSELEAKGDIKKTDGVSDGNVMRYGVPIVVTFVAGYYLLKRQSTFKNCKSTSMWLILGGAASGMVTEFAAQTAYKKKTKSLEKDYKNKIEQNKLSEKEGSDKNTEAQTLALELMKDQEKARKKAASTRQTGHTLAAALYGAAVVAAIYEQVQLGGVGANCLASDAPASEGSATIDLRNFWLDSDFRNQFAEFSYLDKVTEPEFLEMVARKVMANIFIGDALAQDDDGPTPGKDPEPKQEPESPLTGMATNAASSAAMNNLFSGEAAAQATPTGPEAIKAVAENSELGAKTSNWVDKGLATPWVRGALAAVLGGYSLSLVSSAKKNKKIADQRIKAIDEILASYVESGGAEWASCSEAERKNPAKPACYCYNKDGSVNQTRVNRVVCQKYASSDFVAASNYGGAGSSGYAPVRACIKDGGKIEEDCQVCKKSPTRCPAIAKANLGTLSLGGGMGLTELVKQSNELTTGRLGASELNAANLEQMAARITKAKNKMEADKKFAPTFKKVDKLASDFQKAAPALVKKAFASNPELLASLGNSISPAASTPKELEGNEKINKALAAISESSLSSGKKSSASSGSQDYDFGFGDSSAGGVVIDSANEIMEKDFAITGDIHKNPENNIFQILSLRYQRSGLRRLFDAEGKSEADAAGESDINKK